MPPLRELALLARSGDVGALRALVAEEAAYLEGPLGLPAARIRAVAELDDRSLGRAVEQLLHGGRRRARQARLQAQRARATAGVEKLVSGAIWSGNARAHLDPGLLLGPVLADGSCLYLGFHVGDASVYVGRRRLLALRAVAPSLPGLAASVDEQRLSFRWRDGRGGLDFHSLDLSRSERERVQHVVLVPAQTVVVAGPVLPLPHPPPGASTFWFGEALADLHFHP